MKTPHISNIIFDHCVFKGPSAITWIGNTEVKGCGFAGRLEDMWIIAEPNRKYMGVGVFVHCKFKYCEFGNLALIGSKELKDKFRSGSVHR